MDRATYLHFIAGLEGEIRDTGLTQKKFAPLAGTSATNLSRVLSDKGGCSPSWRKKMCTALGTTVEAVIARGEREATPQQSTIFLVAPSVPESIDVMAAVGTFVRNAAVTEEKLRFWSDLFEYLPCAVLLLRDGKVLFQNQESRLLCPSATIGENLCQTCREKGEDDTNCISCLVEKAQVSGGKAKFHKEIQGKSYVISTSFIKINSIEYQVILRAQIDGCGKVAGGHIGPAYS